jgi:hypothetical protein
MNSLDATFEQRAAVRTQLKPTVLMIEPTPAPIELKPTLTVDSLKPRWTTRVGGYGLTFTPKKESGGFKLDIELAW